MARQETWTVGEVLRWTESFFGGRGLDSPRLDAEVLLAHTLTSSRIALYTDHARPLSADERDTFRGLVRRRAAGEPVAQLTGQREFWSLPFLVDRRVLVPRPETEVLIEECLRLYRPATEGATAVGPGRIVDVGTGSGVIAVVLARELPAAAVFGVDVDREALDVAAENLRRHGLADRVLLRCGSLLEPVRADGPFDLIVANLPYVATAAIATLAPDVRDYEPRRALDGGADGAEIVRELLREAGPALAPGGHVVLELGDGPQIEAVADFAGSLGVCHAVSVRRDYAGRERILTLRRR